MRTEQTAQDAAHSIFLRGIEAFAYQLLEDSFTTGDSMSDKTKAENLGFTDSASPDALIDRAAATGTPIEAPLSAEDKARIGTLGTLGTIDGSVWTEEDVRLDRAMRFDIPVETAILLVEDQDKVGKPKTNADRQRLAEARAKITVPEPIKDQYVDSPPEAGLVVSRTTTAGPNIDMTTSWAPPAPLKGEEDKVYTPPVLEDVPAGKTRLSHAESGDQLQ